MYIISIYCGSKFPQTLNFCKIEDTDQGAEVTIELLIILWAKGKHLKENLIILQLILCFE